MSETDSGFDLTPFKEGYKELESATEKLVAISADNSGKIHKGCFRSA